MNAGEKPNLIVVSCREPYVHKRTSRGVVCERPAGGLVTALEPAMQRLGGLWIAWGDGSADRDFVDAEDKLWVPPEAPAYQLRRIWLTQEEREMFYLGFANQYLWPLCHMFIDALRFKRVFWQGYKAVNEKFATAVLEEAGGAPAAVWIQDYHFACAPHVIKSARPDLPVSLFWHIPWPPWDIFRFCSQKTELLECLLACDLIGFHLDRYCENFVACARECLGANVGDDGFEVEYRGQCTAVKSFPIEIDSQLFQKLAASQKTENSMQRLERKYSLAGRKVGLGVDRLDYTKGIPEKLRALDVFFTRYPQFIEKFVFIQVLAPSRSKIQAYRVLTERVLQKVEELNIRFGTNEWKPVVCINSSLDRENLVPLYRMADLMLITPVQDGMNLVAKEYVASQIDEKGVLLLSEFAGAHEEMKHSITINPYDSEGVADAIRRALEMPEAERKKRIRASRDFVSKHDANTWLDSVMGELASLADLSKHAFR
ncbi:MAG: trehalose-6-phosphate synthase [Candidatus Eiseniibacteriota bacterium]|nr:MAG: trehalose-6-phosphate synthase [Candidatus Eisenbacteria bacterium]